MVGLLAARETVITGDRVWEGRRWGGGGQRDRDPHKVRQEALPDGVLGEDNAGLGPVWMPLTDAPDVCDNVNTVEIWVTAKSIDAVSLSVILLCLV